MPYLLMPMRVQTFAFKAEAYELAKGRLSDGGQLDRKYFEYFSIEDFFKLETTNNKKKSTYLSKILID